METKDWYIEYATGSISNRNQVCNIKEFADIAKNNIGKEIYRSMFLYDKTIIDFIKTNQTVVGFNGTQSIDKIVIDVDYIINDNELGNQTRKKVLNVVDAMEKLTIDPTHYNLWFSGKGFHIHLANVYKFEDSNQIAKQVRATMQRDFGEHIDLIYDSRRLIRAGFSLNKKTGLYKVPISFDELETLTYQQITELAKEPRQDYKPHRIKQEKLTALEAMDMSRKNIAEVRKVFDNAKGETTRFITCAQHIYNAGHVPSKRHKHLIALVSIWRKKYAFDKVGCDFLARAYMSNMDKPLPSVEVSKIVSDVFKNDYYYSCSHPDLQPYCDSKCMLYKYKNLDEESNVLTAEDMINNLIDHYQSDYTNRQFDLKTIFPFMSKSHLFTTGQLVTLIGDTGLGKTAFISYLITQLPQLKTLFLSLEVDEFTMSRRLLQASLSKSKEEIIQLLKNRDMDLIRKANEQIDHIKLECSSPDIQDLGSHVSEHEAKILVVDTIDRVPAKYVSKDDFARQEAIANGLKDLAMKEDVLVIAIHHISKSASRQLKETRTLDVHSGKGNSAIEQKSDQFITFDGRNPRGKHRIVKSEKARDESKFEITLNFDWNTFTFGKRN